MSPSCFRRPLKHSVLFAVLFVVTGLIAGCHEDRFPGAVALSKVSPFPGLKHLRFTWDAAGFVNFYRLLESTDGGTVFNAVSAGLVTPQTDYALRLPLFRRANTLPQYRVETCNDAGCTNSNTITTTVADLDGAIGFVKAINAEAGDEFGVSVAISGDASVLAIGAHRERGDATSSVTAYNNNAVDAGAVYVFSRTGTVWTFQAYLKATDLVSTALLNEAAVAGDRFGAAIALDAGGTTLLIGAPGRDGGKGAAYVFTRSGTMWTEQTLLQDTAVGAGDALGGSLAISDDGLTIALAATGGDGVSSLLPDSGAVYVYTGSAAAWTLRQTLRASNADAGDHFGTALALSYFGTRLVVSAPEESSPAADPLDNSAAAAGAVYVFGWNGTAWTEQSALVKASVIAAGDRFGAALALNDNGDALLVGAPGEDSDATGTAGMDSNANAAGSGAAYYLSYTTAWTQTTFIKATNTGAGDGFGSAVAFNGDGKVIAVGAPFEASDEAGLAKTGGNDNAAAAGAVYAWVSAGTTAAAPVWGTGTYVKASNAGAGDQFGAALAVSGDGSTLAPAAPFEDSDDTDGDGTWTADFGVAIGGAKDNGSALSAGTVYLY